MARVFEVGVGPRMHLSIVRLLSTLIAALIAVELPEHFFCRVHKGFGAQEFEAGGVAAERGLGM